MVDSTHYVLTNPNLIAAANDVVEFNFHVAYSGEKPLAVEVVMNGEDVCGEYKTFLIAKNIQRPSPSLYGVCISRGMGEGVPHTQPLL